MNDRVKGKTLGVGITGGISAYKSAELVSRLVQSGATVYVLMTAHAQEFIAPLTFESLSGNPVVTELFGAQGRRQPRHLHIAESIDLLVVAPATANFIGKLSSGIADDALTTTAISVTCPIILCPAMNERMWKNKLVQRNVEELKRLGYIFVGPEEGWLACGVYGVGRMASVENILQKIHEVLG